MEGRQIVAAACLSCLIGTPILAAAKEPKSIALTEIGRYSAGASTVADEPRTEIAAFDPATKRLFSVNLNLRRLDVLDLNNPASPVLAQSVSLGGKPNSVAVHDGIVAVAVEGAQKTDLGSVQFFNASGALLNKLTVGALPDMLTFSPDGRWLLVANEGEPSLSWWSRTRSVTPSPSSRSKKMPTTMTMNRMTTRTKPKARVCAGEPCGAAAAWPLPGMSRRSQRHVSRAMGWSDRTAGGCGRHL